MKNIPFSSNREFQRETRRAVRENAFAESAVWAVFAATSAISVFLSLGQITPPSVQSNGPKDGSVVCEQQKVQLVYPIQTT